MESALQSRLDKLRHNRTSGAVDLALEALDIARDWLASGRPIGGFAAELGTMHPAIATVRNVAREMRSCPGDLAARIAGLRHSLLNGNTLIAGKVSALIPREWIVITLSNSSTVREALTVLGPRGVYVMESNPGGEGAAMADALRSRLRGKPGHAFVDLIADDSIRRYVPLADCALVGIDTFDASGAIWHKIGTLPLAGLCRQHRKPFYAAGHSLKRSDSGLSETPPRDLQSDAQLFDRTPGSLVTKLITELG